MNKHSISAKKVKERFLDPVLHPCFARLNRAGSTFANLAGAGAFYLILHFKILMNTNI